MIPMARGRARRVLAWVLWAFGAASLGACGGGGGGQENATRLADGGRNYYPMAVGDRWVYRSWSDDGQAASQILLLKATEAAVAQGRAVVALRYYKAVDGSEDGVQYLAVDDEAVTLLPDPSTPIGSVVIPSIDLLRFPLAPGTTFQQLDQTLDAGGDYDGDGHNESWHIVSQVNAIGLESVQTDVGRLDNCLHVRTVVTQTGIYTGGHAPLIVTSTIDDWYAAGIGLVREDGQTSSESQSSSQHLILANYAVGGVRSETTAPQATLVKPSGTQGPFTVIELSYSEAMDIATVAGDTVRLLDASGNRVPVTVARGSSSFAFYPVNGTLATGTYNISVDGGATDLVGNALAAATWSFDVDATAPAVVATTPQDQASYVPLDAQMTIDFSEEVDPASIGGAVQLVGTTYLPVDVTVAGRRLTVKPQSPLSPRTAYDLLVQPPIRDKLGNSMAATVAIHFTTDPGAFDYPKTSSIGSSPTAVAIGDVTGDGRNDVVMTNWFYFDATTDYKLFVFPQRPDGTLGAPVAYATRSEYVCKASAIAVADVNGDGRKDVVIAEGGCGIEILLQNANGGLESGSFLASGESHMMRVVDLDGDGRADIVGIGWGTNQVAVWKQAVDGTMMGPTLYALEHYGWEDLDVGDVTGDGRPDIVVSSGQGDLSRAIGMLPQQSNGSFASPQYFAIGTPVGSVAVGDVNGDGRNDLIFGRWFESSIGVMYQDASGALGAWQTIAAPAAVEAIEVADVDADGRRDIVARTGGGFGIYRQGTDGTLAGIQSYTASIAGANEPQSIAVGDINGDGYPDLVGAGLTYVLNLGPTTVAAAPRTRAASVLRKTDTTPVSHRTWMPLKGLPRVSALATTR